MAETRFGDVVFRDGQGFSERAPTESETISKVLRRPRRRSGGGSSSSAAVNIEAERSRQAEQQRIQEESQKQAQQQAKTSSGPSATQQRAIQAQQQSSSQTPQQQANQQFTSRVSSKESRDRAAAAEEARQERAERFRIGLSEKEKKQSTGQVIKGRFKEVGTGIAKAGIGITEGAVNLASQFGTQTITPGEERKTFKFGGKLGEIRDSPATTGSLLGQAQVILPALGAGAAGLITAVKSVGPRLAAKETAGAFSPLRIRSGSFGELETQKQVDKLKFDVVSLKSQKGEVTVKRIFGTARGDPSVKIDAVQFSKGFGSKEVGKTISTIQAPKTTFRAGEFETGMRAIRTETAFVGAKGAPSLQSKAFGVSLKSLQGGGAVGRTRTTADVSLTTKGSSVNLNQFAKVKPITTGGLTQKGANFDVFATGLGGRVAKISPTSRSELIRVKDISVRGIEFDLSKASPSTGLKFTSSTPKGTPSLGLKQATASPIITKPSVNIPSIKQVVTSPTSTTIITRSAQRTTQSTPSLKQKTAPQSTFQIPKQLQPQSTLQTPTQGLLGAVTTSTKTEQKIINVTTVRSGSSSRSRTVQTPTTAPLQTTDQIPRIMQIPQTIQIQQPRFAPTPTPGINLGRPKVTPEKIPFSFALPKIPKAQGPQRGFGNVGLEVRRGGKFFELGRFKQATAFTKGKKIVTGTLAATFRLTGASGIRKAPKGFRIKKTNLGNLFIEKRGRRLSTGSETREIRAAKAKKPKKKKTSRGKKK